MQWVITESSGVDHALEERLGEPNPSCLNVISNDGVLPRSRRLDIYAEAYFSRLLECLEADFKTVCAVLGEDLFAELVAEYLEIHPSRSYTVAKLGNNFSAFLRNHSVSDDRPFLADLVTFELMRQQIFAGPDPITFDVAKLQNYTEMQWLKVTLKRQSSCVLFESRWPLDEIFANPLYSITSEQPVYYLALHRKTNFGIGVRRLTKQEYDVLQLMNDWISLGELCETIEDRIDVSQDEAPSLMQWFSAWVEGQLVSITV